MKQILINGDMTGMIFQKEATARQINVWVNSNLHRFNLNEEHSCESTVDDEDTLVIRGDEDRIELVLEPIELIRLNPNT